MNKTFFKPVLLLVCLLLSTTTVQSQTVVGWLEHVTLLMGDQKILVSAKMDSGADHSSVHATHIETSMQHGQTWVKFNIIDQYEIEVPLYRYAQVKTKTVGVQNRPVVWLELCLNGQKKRVEVNLVDRHHFSSPMLIGRSALSGVLINPEKTNLTLNPACLD